MFSHKPDVSHMGRSQPRGIWKDILPRRMAWNNKVAQHRQEPQKLSSQVLHLLEEKIMFQVAGQRLWSEDSSRDAPNQRNI